MRRATRALTGLLGRVTPRPVAAVTATAIVAGLTWGFGQGVLFTGFLDVASGHAVTANGATAAGVVSPTSRQVSGGPGSLVGWDTLGAAGRDFVTGAVPAGDLAAFSGPDAVAPIRVYVGLDTAPTAESRAALAVRELERTGAFDRSVIAVITTTGTGWINPDVARALEYLYAGDSALVATQYSYLPSWISFLTDRREAAASATVLVDVVRDRLATIPATERPRLAVYGESLGAHATEHAFADPVDLAAATDAALLVGPPHASPLWRHLTEQRTLDSPMWRPVLDGLPVRFGQQPADLRAPAHARPSVVYLQNASDPIVWWSPDLLLRRPAWLDGDRGPDVSGAMRWYPIVTFWQVTVDLVSSTQVPAGHGHSYGGSVADAWAAMVPPPGWTDADTARLRALLS